jgi:RNA polymerase sigma factor (sigma-70 family)
MMAEVGTEPDLDAELYARHAAELVRFATVLHGPSEADDLVANAVLRSFTSPAWPLVENRRAYLYRAVLNEARQSARSRRRRHRREQAEHRPDALEPPTQVRPEVIAAVRRLDHRQRAIVFFTYWQDLTPAEIAAELGISVRTVQRQLADARRRLGKELR